MEGLAQNLSARDALIAVLDQSRLTCKDTKGCRLPNDPYDCVRTEIAAALNWNGNMPLDALLAWHIPGKFAHDHAQPSRHHNDRSCRAIRSSAGTALSFSHPLPPQIMLAGTS